MRTLKTVAFAGLLGAFAFASDASACHKKKCACPAPAPVVACAPAPVVECAPAKKKCHMPKMPKMGCHKKAAPVVAECAPATYAAPVSYAAPVAYAAPQASPQASGQR